MSPIAWTKLSQLSSFFLLSLASCAGHSARTEEARSALDAGSPKQALALLNEELDVKSGSELPDEVDGDNALLILDRSMVQQSLEDYPSSSRDLETADKQIELLDFSRSAVDDIGKYLFSDDTGPYKAPPYEKLLINTMNLENYLVRHDLTGAKVEARRLAIMQKYLADSNSPTISMMAPGSYLAGFAFEKSGRIDEALHYYDDALAQGVFPSLEKAVSRLLPLGSYRSERLSALAKEAPAEAAGQDTQATHPGAIPDDEPSSELLLIVNYGRVPAKIARRIPIGLALTYGALYLSNGQSAQANELAAQGLVTWVNYPDLEETVRPISEPSVSVNGQAVRLDLGLAVDVETKKAYERDKGAIIASAITRMISRVIAGKTAEAAAGDNQILGVLLSLFTQATLTALDTPDTRSWSTLPARIGFARVELPPGRHRLSLAAHGARKELTVELKPGAWEAAMLSVLR